MPLGVPELIIILVIVLLVLGFLYNKYQDKINQWL